MTSKDNRLFWSSGRLHTVNRNGSVTTLGNKVTKSVQPWLSPTEQGHGWYEGKPVFINNGVTYYLTKQIGSVIVTFITSDMIEYDTPAVVMDDMSRPDISEPRPTIADIPGSVDFYPVGAIDFNVPTEGTSQRDHLDTKPTTVNQKTFMLVPVHKSPVTPLAVAVMFVLIVSAVIYK